MESAVALIDVHSMTDAATVATAAAGIYDVTYDVAFDDDYTV